MCSLGQTVLGKLIWFLSLPIVQLICPGHLWCSQTPSLPVPLRLPVPLQMWRYLLANAPTRLFPPHNMLRPWQEHPDPLQGMLVRLVSRRPGVSNVDKIHFQPTRFCLSAETSLNRPLVSRHHRVLFARPGQNWLPESSCKTRRKKWWPKVCSHVFLAPSRHSANSQLLPSATWGKSEFRKIWSNMRLPWEQCTSWK